MTHSKRILVSICFVIISHSATAAMHVSKQGTGQVLIFPYYTVNNNLNTLYTVVNTTPDTKAIKVRFLEGQNSREVLDFNVYLDGYDVWTGALGPGQSTITGHQGQPTAIHYYQDHSCTPYLQTEQQFVPYILDIEDPQNNHMQRVREGHIEIIEMATFNGPTVGWSDAGLTGVPANCAAMQADWDDNGIYDTADEDVATGGLMGVGTLVDVANGLTIEYQALAIENFWINGAGAHTEPGSLFPHLAFANTETQVDLGGVTHTAVYHNGAEAMTSLLMSYELFNEYAIESVANGQTAWVISQPTKNFHVNASQPIPPYSTNWDQFVACEDFTIDIWDQEAQIFNEARNGGPPMGALPALCYATVVLEFYDPDQGTNPGPSPLLGSYNHILATGYPSDNATGNGWARINFDQPGQQTEPFSGTSLLGLPAIGFQIQKTSNTQAQPGLLAQYSRLSWHKGKAAIATVPKQAMGAEQ